MARFDEALFKMYKLEFSKPGNALHWNEGETGHTFMGIYKSAHPDWSGWKYIDACVKKYSGDVKDASEELYYNDDMRTLVGAFYQNKFWEAMRLSQINSQHIAEEMFIFGVNVGIKTSIKAAQRCAGVEDDGLIGSVTIAALNSVDERQFDVEFDQEEVYYYESLGNPRYINGWINRAYAV
jgi:lysozyme family protein